jgi:hypothetical protein
MPNTHSPDVYFDDFSNWNDVSQSFDVKLPEAGTRSCYAVTTPSRNATQRRRSIVIIPHSVHQAYVVEAWLTAPATAAKVREVA